MKQFAFPFSVYCKDDTERSECIKILNELGYKPLSLISGALIVSNKAGENGIYTDLNFGETKYDFNRHHIPHFDAALVRDIAAACTNDTWQVGEPCYCHDVRRIDYYVKNSGYKRPTLAEICAHHGYEIKGKDIVKIEPKYKDLPTIEELQERCIKMWNDEFKALMSRINPVCDKTDRIKELEAENKEITERHETFTRNIDKVISNLEAENAQLKAKLKDIEQYESYKKMKCDACGITFEFSKLQNNELRNENSELKSKLKDIAEIAK